MKKRYIVPTSIGVQSPNLQAPAYSMGDVCMHNIMDSRCIVRAVEVPQEMLRSHAVQESLPPVYNS